MSSWNLSGAVKETLFLINNLKSPITFISKNVCHAVVYDE